MSRHGFLILADLSRLTILFGKSDRRYPGTQKIRSERNDYIRFGEMIGRDYRVSKRSLVGNNHSVGRTGIITYMLCRRISSYKITDSFFSCRTNDRIANQSYSTARVADCTQLADDL